MFSCFCKCTCKDTKPFITKLRSLKHNNLISRNAQVTVVGAANQIGSLLALYLKQNNAISHLKLYDDDRKIKIMGLDLEQIPGGPIVSTFASVHNLPAAVCDSHIIVMVARLHRKPGETREQMMDWNASPVLTLCRTVADYNPDAFLAISTNPINSIVPFASTVLQKYNSYNPYKLLGITHIDTARSRAFAGKVLKVDPETLYVPVIGGHSDHTIIPLFSNMCPSNFNLDSCQVDTLTRLVRKAGTEVVLAKNGTESATMAMAWSINEFVIGLVEALRGNQVTLNCYTANPFFGTRYFSGPTKIGINGIVQTCSHVTMSEYERYMLNAAVPIINRDIAAGEEYFNYVQALGRQ